MINVFDNTTARDCARIMKEMGFFGDYIIAARTSPKRLSLIRGALRNGWFKSSIARLCWKDTPQGFHFWNIMYQKIQ